MPLCRTIYCPLIALHVSSDIFTHHQGLLNRIFTASGNTHIRYCLAVSWKNQNFDSPTTPAGSDVRITRSYKNTV
jgi:hypothetical protein